MNAVVRQADHANNIRVYLLERRAGPVPPATWPKVLDIFAEVSEDWTFYTQTVRKFNHHDFDTTCSVLKSLHEDVGAMVVLVTPEGEENLDDEIYTPFVYVGSNTFFTVDDDGEQWSIDRETLIDIAVSTGSELCRGYWYA